MRTVAVVADLGGSLTRAWIDLDPPRPDEAVVRVRFGGICGSDLHYWRHGRVGESVMTAPLVLGHEVVGEVESAAADGTGPPVGAPVFVHPARTCGTCAACRTGRANLCVSLRYLGSAARVPHTPGAFADRVVVPAARLLRVDDLPLERAALVEPASVAWHAVDRAVRLVDLAGARVAVVGCGPIGLLCVAVVRARYPGSTIHATDLHARAVAQARVLGADEAVLAGDAELGPGSYDVVVESSGSEAGLATAIRLARPGGAVVAVGMLPDPTAAPVQLVVGRELDLVGSSRFADEAGPVIDALRDGTLDVDAVVSHRFAAADVVEAFGVAADPSISSKVLLDFADEGDGEART